MRRWELNNEYKKIPEYQEQQAIKLLVSEIVGEIENLPPMTMVATVENTVDWYEKYKEILESLNEEVGGEHESI